MHDQLEQRPANRAEGDVTRHHVAAGDRQQCLRNGFEIACQRAGQHQLTGLADLLHEVGRAAAGLAPQGTERLAPRRVVLQQRHLVHELVAGGAIHAPVIVQALPRGEDLFDVDGQMDALFGRRGAALPGRAQAIDATTQAPAVAARVGQAIDVVDAQTIDQAIADELEDPFMGLFEYHGSLDPQAAELIDIEEASPVDVVGRGAPAGQAIVLAFEQGMQAPEALCRGAVVMLQRGFQLAAGLAVLEQLGKFAAQLPGGDIRGRLGFQGVEVTAKGTQRRVLGQAQDLAVAWRGDREAMIVMLGIKRAVFHVQLQGDGALLQRLAIVATEKRHQ